MADIETWRRELDLTRPDHESLAHMFKGYEDRVVELQARLAAVEKALTAADGMCANCHHGDLAWAAARGEVSRG